MKLKKALSTVLAVIVAAAMLVMPTASVSAADSTITINGKSVKAGDKVELTAVLTAPPSMAALNCWVMYDKSVMKLSDETLAAVFGESEPTQQTKAAEASVFPVLSQNGSFVWNFSAKDTTNYDSKTYQTIKFNATDVSNHYDFSSGKVLCKLVFDVTGTTPGSYRAFADVIETCDSDYNDVPFTLTNTTTVCPKGDFNADETVSSLDVIYLQKYIVAAYEPSARGLNLGDVNSDGVCNMKDALLIQKFLVEGSF